MHDGPTIPFVKMHGAGNDYVLVDGADVMGVRDLGNLARAMSARRTGIGADGLIVVRPSECAAARMEMYNSDGSRSSMCGNGLRLVAKFLADRGRIEGHRVELESDAGLHRAELFRRAGGPGDPFRGQVVGARVSMGLPVGDPRRIPLEDPAARVNAAGFAEIEAILDGAPRTATCLSVGNPHCVVLVENVEATPVERWGAALENDARFPERVNVEFVQVVEAGEILQRTWERGAGETHSCGSGACAAAAAVIAAGAGFRRVKVRQRGGTVEVEWEPDGELFLTGPAELAFSGEWPRPGPPM